MDQWAIDGIGDLSANIRITLVLKAPPFFLPFWPLCFISITFIAVSIFPQNTQKNEAVWQ